MMNENQPCLRVFIAENEPQVRLSLTIFLEQSLCFSVVGETNSDSEIAEGVRLTRPDILLVAAELIEAAGNHLAPALKAEFPDMKIILLNSPSSADHPPLTAGIDAIASKLESPKQLAALLQSRAG